MLTTALFLLAACGGQDASAPDVAAGAPSAAEVDAASDSVVTDTFILAYQSMVNGEIEPCG